jgi:hypothetical protein
MHPERDLPDATDSVRLVARLHWIGSSKQRLYFGLLLIAVTIAIGVVAKTTGPKWLWWLGIPLGGGAIAFVDGARQLRRRNGSDPPRGTTL